MLTAIFLILWIEDQPFPTARFIHSYETADACYEYIERSALEKKIKKQLACIEMSPALGGTKKL